MIKLQVIGNLGRDAHENLVSNRRVINFSVAHTEKYKNRDGQVSEKTTWVSCSYWTDKTGVLPYLRKGTQVYVEGSPSVSMYDKRDGSGKEVELKLNVFSIQLLGAAKSATGSQNEPPKQNFTGGGSYPSSADEVTEPLDDLPF
jgi:single-strand DNA-binding protein